MSAYQRLQHIAITLGGWRFVIADAAITTLVLALIVFSAGAC